MNTNKTDSKRKIDIMGAEFDMRKRINNYLSYMDRILANEIPTTSGFDMQGEHYVVAKKDVIPTRKEYEKLIEQHLNQIAFFSHERLVHLIVTVLFAILAFSIFIVCMFQPSIPLYILLLLLMVLLIPYIMHYYLLENGVQKMYRQYDELVKRIL